MNNILINNKDFIIEQTNCKIDYCINEINLKINGNVHIYDFNDNEELKLNIEVLENSSLNYYMFSNNEFKNKEININNQDNSKTNFNYSFITNNKSELTINNNILGNNIKSDIRIRSVAKDKSNCVINSNGYVLKNTTNNEFNEDVRGLNLDEGIIVINPNMYIDTNDVIANHNATIGNIDNNYLFYLNSKGINNEDAKKLIVSGFIKSILSDEIKEEINL